MFHVYISDGSERVYVKSCVTREEAEAIRELEQERCNQHTDGNFGAYIEDDTRNPEIVSVDAYLNDTDDVHIVGFAFPN